MPKKTPATIDWSLIERIARRSFTGGGVSAEEHKLLEVAHRTSPEEYSRRTAAVRDEERDRIRRP